MNISNKVIDILDKIIELQDMTVKLQYQLVSLRDILAIIVLNAELIPDVSRNNSTDIYSVPIDDIETAKHLLNTLKLSI